MNIGLVSCGAHKQPQPARAESLYTSELFRRSAEFARSGTDAWFILSARHGLLPPGDVIDPYDQVLASKVSDRQEWAQSIFAALRQRIPDCATLIFLAGSTYRDPLQSLLERHGYECVAPLRGLGIGQQLQWTGAAASDIARFQALQRLYSELTRLRSESGQFVTLSDLHLHKLPNQGVYFFFDPDECSRASGVLPRLVRIGTHAVSVGSKATLWQRLRTHRGTGASGGNHRSSIFRLHVGAAMLQRETSALATWGRGQDAPAEVRHLEAELEGEVSRYLAKLVVAHIEISDLASPNSARSYIERNSIALVSTPPLLDGPTSRWLGSQSVTAAIRESGLWNVNYVGEHYEPAFLDVLNRYVSSTIGTSAKVTGSIAPEGWRTRLSGDGRDQLSLGFE